MIIGDDEWLSMLLSARAGDAARCWPCFDDVCEMLTDIGLAYDDYNFVSEAWLVDATTTAFLHRVETALEKRR